MHIEVNAKYMLLLFKGAESSLKTLAVFFLSNEWQLIYIFNKLRCSTTHVGVCQLLNHILFRKLIQIVQILCVVSQSAVWLNITVFSALEISDATALCTN